MKNVLAFIGGAVVLYAVCKTYGTLVHGYYAEKYEDKLEEYKREHPHAKAA
jgi:hypothetical protein